MHNTISPCTLLPSRHAQFAGLVCRCFQRGNPTPAGDPSVELVSSTFTQLGGDSLAALLVVGAIQRETNAVVPPEVVLAGRAAEVVQYMAEKMGLKVVNEELYGKLEPHDRGWSLLHSDVWCIYMFVAVFPIRPGCNNW